MLDCVRKHVNFTPTVCSSSLKMELASYSGITHKIRKKDLFSEHTLEQTTDLLVSSWVVHQLPTLENVLVIMLLIVMSSMKKTVNTRDQILDFPLMMEL